MTPEIAHCAVEDVSIFLYLENMTPIKTKQLQSVWRKHSKANVLRNKNFASEIIHGEVIMRISDNPGQQNTRGNTGTLWTKARQRLTSYLRLNTHT